MVGPRVAHTMYTCWGGGVQGFLSDQCKTRLVTAEPMLLGRFESGTQLNFELHYKNGKSNYIFSVCSCNAVRK